MTDLHLLRCELARLAGYCEEKYRNRVGWRRWPEWSDFCSIFADALEEAGQYAEAAAARCAWEVKPNANKWQMWRADVPNLDGAMFRRFCPVRQRGGYSMGLAADCRLWLNREPLLHFPAMTLRLKGQSEGCLRFTFSSNRGTAGIAVYQDTTVTPGGYLDLFKPRPAQEKREQEGTPLFEILE